MPARRDSAAARRERLFPDAAIAVDGAGHPARRPPAPLLVPIAVGRLRGPDGRRHAVREADLLLAALDPAGDLPDAEVAVAAAGYAAHLLSTAPTIDARLRGRALRDFLEGAP
jgi:hypothetical protein